MKDPVRRRLEALGKVLGRHLTDQAKLDLLTFWGRNPGGWFARAAIHPFTLLPRSEIDQALSALVEDGVVDCREHGGVPFYALSEEYAVRRAVLELGRLTPNERRFLIHWCQRFFRSGDTGPRQQQVSASGPSLQEEAAR